MGFPTRADLTKQADQKEAEARGLRAQARHLELLESSEVDAELIVNAAARILSRIRELRQLAFGQAQVVAPQGSPVSGPAPKDESSGGWIAPAGEPEKTSIVPNPVTDAKVTQYKHDLVITLDGELLVSSAFD